MDLHEVKTRFSGFFACKPLKSPVSAKNIFVKVWKCKFLLTENKGFFPARGSKTLAKSRFPRILQIFSGRPASDGGQRRVPRNRLIPLPSPPILGARGPAA
jgi:hypothetical protein